MMMKEIGNAFVEEMGESTKLKKWASVGAMILSLDEYRKKSEEAYFESNGFWLGKREVTARDRKEKILPLPTIAGTTPKSENTEDLSFRIFTGDLINIRSALVCSLDGITPHFQ